MSTPEDLFRQAAEGGVILRNLTSNFGKGCFTLILILACLMSPFYLYQSIRELITQYQIGKENPILQQQFEQEIETVLEQSIAQVDESLQSCAPTSSLGNYFTDDALKQIGEQINYYCTNGQATSQNITAENINSIRFLEGKGDYLSTAENMSQVTYACVSFKMRGEMNNYDSAKMGFERANGQWKVIEGYIGVIHIRYWSLTSYC